LHVDVSALSGVPLQSLSMDDVQFRAAADTAPVHAPQVPPVQVCEPRLQMPMFAAGPQGWVFPVTQAHPSFGMPLQLSSLPGAQVSAAAGATPPPQVPQSLVLLSAATTQVWVPGLQRPLPSLPGCSSQARVALAQTQTASSVLSGIPSQLLSAGDVQSRGAANTAPTHDPQAPLVHVWVPRLQSPTSAAGPHACVAPETQGQPSLGWPLHVASSP
jgi:hypothetical protein